MSLVFGLGCLGLSAAQAAELPSIRVASFNIRNAKLDTGQNSWENRQPHLLELLHFLKADVLCLQECVNAQRLAILKEFPEYVAVGESRVPDQDDEQCCIMFSPQRFELRSQQTFWLNEGQIKGRTGWDASLPRIVTWVCLYDRKSGRSFYLFNTHFDHQGPHARFESAKQLASMVQSEAINNGVPQPALICGDLNAGETNEAVVLLTSLFPDTFRKLHPKDKLVGTFNEFSGKSDGDKIDYILGSPDFELLSAKIVRWNYRSKSRARGVQLWPSDHFPVLTELRFLP